MSIYDVNFDKAGTQLLPPDKRFARQKAWIKVVLSPIQWLRDLWFGEYRTGSTSQQWLSTTTYQKYQRAIYSFGVYESLIDNNTDIPLNVASWQLVQGNFIGLSERILYNGRALVLTYALNKRFSTHFRQPPNISDIYIGAHPKPLAVFVIGGAETNSSKVYSNTSTEYIIDSYDFGQYINMTIYVPLAVFNALDPIPANCEKIIRSFVDRYIVAGILYNIQTY